MPLNIYLFYRTRGSQCSGYLGLHCDVALPGASSLLQRDSKTFNIVLSFASESLKYSLLLSMFSLPLLFCIFQKYTTHA